MTSKDLFNDENIQSRSYMKFEKVGDAITGVYLDRQEVPNQLREGTTQVRYTLRKADGSLCDVYGRSGSPAVLPGMEIRKFGDVVGIRFDKELDPPKPGFNKVKVIQVYWAGERDEEALRAHQNPVATMLPGVEEAGDGDDPFKS